MKKRKISTLPDAENVEHDLLKLIGEDFPKLHSSRRNFLKVFGYSLASAALLSACRKPLRMAVPYVNQPPELIPRKPLYYASTYFDGHEYCSILVKNMDGRPIKIEGNPLSNFNGEGNSARIQASVLSLYDDSRLKYPTINGKKAEWGTIDEEVEKDLENVNNEGGEIVLLTPTIISPTTRKLINSFGAGMSKFRWVEYDTISYSAILEANELCFDKAVIPDYNFAQAKVVVGINCDFLGTWLAPVHFIPGYIERRKLNDGRKDMLLHIQVESSLTLTGSNADKRIKIKPSEEKTFLLNLYNNIAEAIGMTVYSTEKFREDLSVLTRKLLEAKGRSIVVSGTNDREIQVIVNSINSMLGNYSGCIDLENQLNISSGRDSEMQALVNDMYRGNIKALIMCDVNPVYDYSDPGLFIAGLEKVPVTINMAVKQNESVGKAKYECPVNHFLESWNDAEIMPGSLSLSQPCINPLFNTRSFQDSLLRWSGKTTSWQQLLSSSWEKEYFPFSGSGQFRDFWNKSLSNGVFNYKQTRGKPASLFNSKALDDVQKSETKSDKRIFEIVFAESISIGNGIHSNNPWLMELPDPVSRQTWENVAGISPTDAVSMGVVTGDMIKIGQEITIPALVQPGQAEGTISISLGYGHENSGPVSNGNGVNVFPLTTYNNGNRSYVYSTDEIKKTGQNRQVALVQTHDSMEGRPLIREATLTDWRNNPEAGNESHSEFEKMHKSLYPDAPFDGFHWAMAIDLNACIGCNTCVIACQAENNSPTVGKNEVLKNRIMQWIKVHRYYSDDNSNPKVYFQPVFCQHCDDAPCENVCPVSATNHSNEGLNQMAYNRCVGTKYCMNNCPYKVRRFNWFRYTSNEKFNYNSASDLGKMVLNPDVTVRERGVVEKCSFCVQRIQAKKLEAKLEGRVLNDLEIKPACMQACPAGAIVFGNIKDTGSRVSQLFSDPRRYHLLEELHTLPSVGFLTKIRNDEEIS
ncbi:MAG TPA: 4Fe-4S dicluster domain-containing protein [Bacteroidales bacterium]|nr:4Fe-4S dicluster domain-containing protein [Bacteroidales bacterium]